ncbi:MAG: 16S rRNA (uracil(1498)-N(3))-methyltransferase [Ignavibacteria bacterium]|nr:16S rRNA (uracil(1498)-N(3))-methyltransferase [Ignavibacteria bacterium]
MEYIFTPKQYISASSLTITDEEARHLLRVLRKKKGEKIFVTDGERNVYECEIENISRDMAECNIMSSYFNLNEPTSKVYLFLAILKNHDRFEYAIEKSVELGVFEIIPLITERVLNKTSDKKERWQKIALSAMKQSCRCYLPEVREPYDFTGAVASSEGVRLIAHEKEDKKLENKNYENVSLFIGPEGGFTEKEIKYAQETGFIVFGLGKRKFRSETAAVASLAKLLVE